MKKPDQANVCVTYGGETRCGIMWIFHVAEEAEFSSAA